MDHEQVNGNVATNSHLDTIDEFCCTDTLLEVDLVDSNNFLKVAETLTRIGVMSKKDKTLFQSCHILHKQGRYYIVSFKELYVLDNKEDNLKSDDIKRRNAIAELLEQWNLIDIVSDYEKDDSEKKLKKIKVVKFANKDKWNLQPKYTIGKD
ncbi:MAG: translational repressor RegA [Saccharospirillaceae bacterium]|nr:translational repressor RegA [Pseudomonadales bacterium]NRB78696.1 translational repressor RegA [Saccharospirillaceae bacterium]